MLSYVLNTQFRLKHLSIADFAIVAKERIFWLSIVTSPQSICDVTRTWGTGILTSRLLLTVIYNLFLIIRTLTSVLHLKVISADKRVDAFRHLMGRK